MSIRRGVDLASFQGMPGQWGPAAGRISWAAVKITEYGTDGSRYVNPDAAADWRALKEHGRARIAYLFAHPGSAANETVAFFVAELTKLGVEDGDMVAVDLEVNDGRTPAQVAEWTRFVLDALKRQFSRVPLLYTYLSFAWDGYCAGLGLYPLWISDPSSPAGKPRIPAPWKTWAIHQYGTEAPIDRDIIAYRSVAEMQATLGKAGTEPARRHRVRKGVHRARRKVAHAGHVTKHAVGKEPVLTAGSLAGLLSAAVAFLGKHLGLHLTAHELFAVMTALVAVAGAVATFRTRPVRVGVLTTALSAVATACVTFGLKLPPHFVAAEMPIVSALVALLVRGHVSPVTKQIPAGADPVPAPVDVMPAQPAAAQTAPAQAVPAA